MSERFCVMETNSYRPVRRSGNSRSSQSLAPALHVSLTKKLLLAEIAHRPRRKALEELAAVAKPDTLLA